VSAIDPFPSPLNADAGLGRHTASFAESADDQFDLLAPTFSAALAQGCRCLFIGHRTTPAGLRDSLARRGCGIEEPLASGQFRFLTAEDTYLHGGCFDADRMLDLWVEAAASARAEGCSGLCASGEVTWLHQRNPGSDRWLEYEYRINELEALPEVGVTCLYDTTTLPVWLVRELRKVHPFVHTNRTVTASAEFASGGDSAAEVPLVEDLEPAADQLPCAQLQLLLSAYVDGQLVRRRRDEVARHLSACNHCAAEAESYRALKSGLASLRVPAQAGPDLWDTVRARLRDVLDPSLAGGEGAGRGGEEHRS